MLVALIFICSVTVRAEPQDCTRSNANTIMRVPAEFANPVTCFMHAQAYLAGSSIGGDLNPSDRVRILCLLRENVIASTPGQ